MGPLVSVVIPTYKRSLLLTDCIDSVIAQTYSTIEIIVVDDNGKGTEFQKLTEERLRPYLIKGQIKYITHEVNKNGSAARNTGYKNSSGDYLLFLDDDDSLLPNMISEQLTHLQSLTEDYGAVYCNSIIKYRLKYIGILRTIKTKSLREGNLCREVLLGKCRFNTSTILFRKSVIEELNGFDEKFRRHQDYELLVRFFSKYKIGCTYLPLVKYDLTKDSAPRVNPTSDYAIKSLFFSERGDLLKQMGIYNDISYDFWLECAINAYLMGEKEVYKQSRANSLKNHHDTFKGLLRLEIFKLLYTINKLR